MHFVVSGTSVQVISSDLRRLDGQRFNPEFRFELERNQTALFHPHPRSVELPLNDISGSDSAGFTSCIKHSLAGLTGTPRRPILQDLRSP